MTPSNRGQIVLVHRYFVPDTPPYAHMLAVIAMEAARLRETTVITGDRPYRAGTDLGPRRSRKGSVSVIRVRLLPEGRNRLLGKAVNAPLFAGKAAVSALRRGRHGVVMAATTPPIVVSLATVLASRLVGARFIYHNQDIYPEILGTVRADAKPAFRVRAARRIDTITGRLSHRIVVLSEDMKNLWVERGIPPERVVVCNNFVASGFHGGDAGAGTEPLPIPARAQRARVVYVGNVGPLQILDRCLAALSATGMVDVDVHGDGRALSALRNIALTGVTFHGPVPSTEVDNALRPADLGLVSLEVGVERAAYPSKILTLLGMGVPLLAFLNPHSDLAREIRDNRLGYVVSDDDANSARAAIEDFLHMSDESRAALRDRCVAHAERYSQAAAMQRWRAIFTHALEGVST